MNLAWRAIHFLIPLILATFLYDQVTKRIPTRLRVDQAPRSKFGIVPVDGFSSRPHADGLDIVLVHGLGSNPDTTWQARKTATKAGVIDDEEYVCWVTDFLPKDIPPALRQNIRVFFYNHDSRWERDAVQTRLWNLGHNMLNRISTEIRSTAEERSRGLLFVGSSYGGLLIKQALVQAKRSQSFAEIAEHTKAVFFLGTPHRGSSFTKWGSMVASALRPIGSNPSILNELAYDSVSLLDLHREFVAITGDNLPIVNFFEERKTRFQKTWIIQWEKFLVTEQSATYEGPRVKNVGLPVDHFSLNKFGSRTAIYEQVLSQILRIITPIASQRQHLYSVPLQTVRSYTHRHSLSSIIEEKLHKCHRDDSAPCALALYGLGGTGKTQLALKYIEDHKDDYNPILWIDARDPETTRSSFDRCAGELQLSDHKTSTQASTLADSVTVQAVLRWLQNRKESDHEWLVVVDNADDFTWGLNKILPKGRRGNIIVTSQDDQSPRLFNSGCEKLRVDIMEPFEAKALLLQHTPWDPLSAPLHIELICNTIVERLGYLALAIDLAGAYIGNNPCQETALKQYLADYDKHQDELLQRDEFRGLSMSDKTVWTVWDTTLDKIEGRYLEVRPVLAFLAHFTHGIIQDELFRLASLGFSSVYDELDQDHLDLPYWLKQFTELDGQEWDSFYYRKALDPLVRYSLVQRVNGEWPGVSMHNLVQWRAMKYKEGQPQSVWYLMFMLAVCRQVTKQEDNPEFRRHAVTHIPSVSQSYLDDIEASDKLRALVFATVGEVYHNDGQWTKAEELIVQAMDLLKKMYGQENYDVLMSMAFLASVYRYQSRWGEAEKLNLELIEMRKKIYGQEHLATLRDLADRAFIFQHQGLWKEAEELHMQVLKMSQKVFGQEHPQTLISMSNLASMYQSQGRLTEAEDINVLVTKTSKRVLGEKHPQSLKSMSNLASTYQSQNRLTEAEELKVQIMNTCKIVLGQKHPQTLTSMSALASTYRRQGRWIEAEKLYVQVIEINKSVLGQKHPDTLLDIARLASMYRVQGRWKEAEQLETQP